jgi:hypothetical protein
LCHGHFLWKKQMKTSTPEKSLKSLIQRARRMNRMTVAEFYSRPLTISIPGKLDRTLQKTARKLARVANVCEEVAKNALYNEFLFDVLSAELERISASAKAKRAAKP